MKHTFEYNIGDEVWLMHKDRPVPGIVTSLWFTRFISCVDFTSITGSEAYYVKIDDQKHIDSYKKEVLFPTKEALLKSL